LWYWNHFDHKGETTPEMATRYIPTINPKEEDINYMIQKINKDKSACFKEIKEHVESLISLGSEITQFQFRDRSTSSWRICFTPNNMRTAWCDSASADNVKRIHWIFHQLPHKTYQDSTFMGKNHQEVVVDLVMKKLNIEWVSEPGKKRSKQHKNCIAKYYAKVLNDKKQTVLKKDNGNPHNTMAFLKRPTEFRSRKEQKKYKREKTCFYVKRKDDNGVYVQFQVSID
jgi:hypothetical protein